MEEKWVVSPRKKNCVKEIDNLFTYSEKLTTIWLARERYVVKIYTTYIISLLSFFSLMLRDQESTRYTKPNRTQWGMPPTGRELCVVSGPDTSALWVPRAESHRAENVKKATWGMGPRSPLPRDLKAGPHRRSLSGRPSSPPNPCRCTCWHPLSLAWQCLSCSHISLVCQGTPMQDWRAEQEHLCPRWRLSLIPYPVVRPTHYCRSNKQKSFR